MIIISTPGFRHVCVISLGSTIFLHVTSVADWSTYVNMSLLHLLFPNGVVENKEDFDVV